MVALVFSSDKVEAVRVSRSEDWSWWKKNWFGKPAVLTLLNVSWFHGFGGVLICGFLAAFWGALGSGARARSLCAYAEAWPVTVTGLWMRGNWWKVVLQSLDDLWAGSAQALSMNLPASCRTWCLFDYSTIIINRPSSRYLFVGTIDIAPAFLQHCSKDTGTAGWVEFVVWVYSYGSRTKSCVIFNTVIPCRVDVKLVDLWRSS